MSHRIKTPTLLRVECRRQVENPEKISGPEAGKMVLLAKCFPCKLGNLSSVLKIQMKRSVTVVCTYNPSSGAMKTGRYVRVPGQLAAPDWGSPSQ